MDAGEHADFNPDHHDIVSDQRYWEEEVMTPPADRFARLRERYTTERFVVQDMADMVVVRADVRALLAALDAAEELATAVEIHCAARIAAHAPVPDRANVEWVQLNIAELTAWWQTKTRAEKYRAATK